MNKAAQARSVMGRFHMFRAQAQDLFRASANNLKGKIFVIAATVNNAGKVSHQGGDALLDFVQGCFSVHPFVDLMLELAIAFGKLIGLLADLPIWSFVFRGATMRDIPWL